MTMDVLNVDLYTGGQMFELDWNINSAVMDEGMKTLTNRGAFYTHTLLKAIINFPASFTTIYDYGMLC
jgi:hypothetical protein